MTITPHISRRFIVRRATVLMEHQTPERESRVVRKNFAPERAMYCPLQQVEEMKNLRRVGCTKGRAKIIFCEDFGKDAGYDKEPSWSAMVRVRGVSSEPVWRVVVVSMRAIQVSSVAEVL
jgi:hypothetical protein